VPDQFTAAMIRDKLFVDIVPHGREPAVQLLDCSTLNVTGLLVNPIPNNARNASPTQAASAVEGIDG